MLEADWVTWFTGFVLIFVTLVSRLLMRMLGALSWCGPNTIRVALVSIQRLSLLFGSTWTRLRLLLLLLLLLGVSRKLLLAFDSLILLVHEVNVVFFLIVEGRFDLLLIIQIWLVLILNTFSFLLGPFLEICRTIPWSAHHSLKVLECDHYNCHIIKWLPH